ncbi:MAG TPA: enoyl-CoA hydratase/isomerase family protein [Aldersonia sp.]
MGATTRTITVRDLADGAADTPLFDADGALSEPVLVVDLDDADLASVAAAVERVPARDRILVGICSGPIPETLAAALDVSYGAASSPHVIADGLAEFLAGVDNNPHASLLAAQVVRISEHLPISEALDVESLAYSTLQGGPEFRRWLDARRTMNRPLPPPVADPVLVDREGDTLRITLNRPERRNAFGTALRDALVEALRLPLLDPSITNVVLDGAGASFCAGGDLDEFGFAPDTVTAHLIRTRAGAGRLIAQLADRTEVRLHGHCVGAGIEIPAFAGHLAADPATVFRLPEVSMGLIPGAGGTVSIPRRIGRWRALHLFVTGTALDAETALAWGLIDVVAGTR